MEESVGTATDLVEQRLCAIVQALDGRNVETDGEELWFEPEGASGLQIRLGGNRQARCYDRSANFAISYGGQPSDAPVSVEFRAALERIKAIDGSPIAGVAEVFGSASQAVVRRFTTASAVGADTHGDQLDRNDASDSPIEPGTIGFGSAAVVAEQAGTDPRQSGCAIRSVVVVGGGTAGYFAALTLRSAFPELDVTLIESSKIPVIGVGEATTTLMPPFLHWQLGLDIVELYREVRPTWKMGIKFDWGLPGDYSFIYPFGDGNPVEAYAHDGHIGNQSVCSLMMEADRAPIVTGDDGEPVSLLERMPFAYHLENKSFVAYLQKCAQRAGIVHIDAQITDVATSADRESVDRLILDDGRVIRSDLYVDASGFRSLLMGKTLGSPFISYAPSLFCDTAVVGVVPQNGTIEPYTTAQTMDAGWCWRIPVEGEDHRGYVFSSAHLTDDQARAEMRAKNPGLGETWTVHFRSGRHEEFWKGNTVAVGNSYGFVEPLESTALHMVIMEVRCLIHGLYPGGNSQRDRDFANRSVGAHWDYLRWFLAVHYKFNRKKDTEFWRTCREQVDVSGIQPLLDRFGSVGPGKEADDSPYAIPDPVFNYHAVLTMLLGQQVPCPPPTRTWLSKAQWDARVTESRALVGRALTQAQALDLLRRRPELLQRSVAPNSGAWMITRTPHAEYVKVPGFWVQRESASISRPTSATAVGRQSSTPQKGTGISYGHLLESIAPPPAADHGGTGSTVSRDNEDDPRV